MEINERNISSVVSTLNKLMNFTKQLCNAKIKVNDKFLKISEIDKMAAKNEINILLDKVKSDILSIESL